MSEEGLEAGKLVKNVTIITKTVEKISDFRDREESISFHKTDLGKQRKKSQEWPQSGQLWKGWTIKSFSRLRIQETQ